jgi:hypothetical protein
MLSLILKTEVNIMEVMDGTTNISADEQMVVDLPTKILDENINLNRIKKKVTIDGWKCLKTKFVKQKKQPNGTVSL